MNDKTDVIREADEPSAALPEQNAQANDSKPERSPEELYTARFNKFSSFYTALVVIVSLGILAAIATAIYYKLIWAAAVAAVSVLCYVHFCTSEMKDKLGLTYVSGIGYLMIKDCRPRYGDTLYIPSRLLWYDVEEIGDGAFWPKKNAELRTLYLPSSLKRIGNDIFVNCDSLETIYFEGSEQAWEDIEKSTDFSKYNIVFDAKYPNISSNKKKKTKNKKQEQTKQEEQA